MMVEYPEKIEEFKSSDELLTNAEEKNNSKEMGVLTKKNTNVKKVTKKRNSPRKKE
jgi:hypothetical protein